MIDLETMSARPDAAIAAIGAVSFDLRNMTIGETFYTTVDLESCEQAGLHFSASTVTWWMKQSDQARRDLVAGEQQNIGIAMANFSSWLAEYCVEPKALRVWGNGANFDPVIMESAYRAVNEEVPWKFWNVRCFRTLQNLYPSVKMTARVGTHHNALDDALHQAQHIFHIRRTMRGHA